MKTKDSDALRGKTVIVTGGSSGIGVATAQAFLGARARVAICARNLARLKEAEAHLGAGERLLVRAADVSDAGRVQAFVEEATAPLGPVAVLDNNAGVAHVGPFVKQPPGSIGAVVDGNLKGVMYMTRAVLAAMVARGEGVIVNVSSGARVGMPPEKVAQRILELATARHRLPRGQCVVTMG